jgi:hypothetical protein
VRVVVVEGVEEGVGEKVLELVTVPVPVLVWVAVGVEEVEGVGEVVEEGVGEAEEEKEGVSDSVGLGVGDRVGGVHNIPRMLWLPSSATYTHPLPSLTSPRGLENCATPPTPLLLPLYPVPAAVPTSPPALILRMRWAVASVTYVISRDVS